MLYIALCSFGSPLPLPQCRKLLPSARCSCEAFYQRNTAETLYSWCCPFPCSSLYLQHTTPVSSVFYLCWLTVNAWYLLFTQPMKVLDGGNWQSQGWSHKTHLGSSDVNWFANCLVKKHLIRNGTARINNYPNAKLTVDCCIYKYPEMLPVHLQWHWSPNIGQLLNRWTNSGFN